MVFLNPCPLALSIKKAPPHPPSAPYQNKTVKGPNTHRKYNTLQNKTWIYSGEKFTRPAFVWLNIPLSSNIDKVSFLFSRRGCLPNTPHTRGPPSKVYRPRTNLVYYRDIYRHKNPLIGIINHNERGNRKAQKD